MSAIAWLGVGVALGLALFALPFVVAGVRHDQRVRRFRRDTAPTIRYRNTEDGDAA